MRLKINHRAGANVFTDRPVICLQVAESSSPLHPEPLRAALDELLGLGHVSDLGPSEDVEGLEKAAAPELLIAALALTLLRKGGIPVERIGKIEGHQEVVQGCWFEISELKHGGAAAQAAVKIANDASKQLTDNQLTQVINSAMQEVDKAAVEPFTRLVLIAADNRGIPWRLASSSTVGFKEIGVGARSRRFHQSFFEVESKYAADLAQNKIATAEVLRRAGISVPEHKLCRSIEEIERAASEIGFPVVVKPLREGGGRGVTVEIYDQETLQDAATAAIRYKAPVIVEKYVRGDIFRILVINGQAVNCSYRRPPTVIGDGKHSIAELCDIENRKTGRDKAIRVAIKPIDIEAIEKIKTSPYRNRGYDAGSILPAGEKVPLTHNPFMRDGGTIENYTAVAHPDYLRLAERIARLTGLWACGVDLIASDITRPFSQAPYWINEANSHPALLTNDFADQPRPIADALLYSIFPGERDYRVPIVAVVSGNGAPALVKAIAGAIAKTGLHAVAAHAGGYEFDGLGFGVGDFATIAGSMRAFFDRSAEAIVVERRPEELSARGFGLNFADIVIFCPPEQGDEEFWRQAGFLAGIAGTAFAVAPSATPPDPAQACPPGLVWISGSRADTQAMAVTVVNAVSELIADA